MTEPPQPSIAPFVAGQNPSDIEILARSSFLSGLGVQDLSRFLELLDQVALPRGTTIYREGDPSDCMYFILEGHASVHRGPHDLTHLGPGDHVGELALVSPHARTTTVHADTVVRLARLSRQRFGLLAQRHPLTALHFVSAVAASLGASLTALSDDVGQMLRQRSLPRRAAVRAVVGGARIEVGTGTLAGTLLPKEVGGAIVVAATLDKKAVSLEAPIVCDVAVEPVTTASFEGRRIYRRSVALLLIEAAREVLPGVQLTFGSRRGGAQLVRSNVTLGAEQAAAIEQQMRVLAGAALPIREELWGPEEVRLRMDEQGWHDVASLLPFYRVEAVPVLVCGKTVALGLGPAVPSTAQLTGFTVAAHQDGLILDFGRDLERAVPLDAKTQAMRVPVGILRPRKPREGVDPLQMVRELDAWLRGMNVTSVGAFDAACVSGQIAEIIRVSEGFHEKHVGRIADAVTRSGTIRVVAIAGPSSSGKTTFIRRLKVQLEVNGVVPVDLGLDDYYVDRERTPRDASGEYDFETVDAIDRQMLADHLQRLLRGERVRTARYDFVTGKSHPEGGAETALGERSILLVEGLHALNPELLGDAVPDPSIFRVFIHPATALPFDRVSAVLPEDIRLLRRIVRDRHKRAHGAAASIARWPSVRRGEEKHVLPWVSEADAVFDSSLVYEPAVLRVYAERYLLEVPSTHPSYVTAHRLRQFVDRFVPIDADHVPRTSLLREFIGGSGFDGT